MTMYKRSIVQMKKLCAKHIIWNHLYADMLNNHVTKKKKQMLNDHGKTSF